MSEEHYSPEELRMAAFDYLRGELDDSMVHAVEEAMIESPAFADYVTRVEQLLESPKKAPVEAETSIDADDLFARISAGIEANPVETTDTPPVVLKFAQPAAQEPESEDEGRAPPARWGAWVALAAAVLAGVAAVLWFAAQSALPPVQPRMTQKPEIPAPVKVEEKVVRPAFGLAELDAVDTSLEAVKLFASSSTHWSIEGKDERRTINLDDGVILVEFVPGEIREVEVRSRDFTVEVIGTVFYASEEQGTVGVVTGKVRVTPRNAAPVVLSAGEEWVRGQGVRSIDPNVMRQAESRVDVDAHIDALARARATESQKRQEIEKPVEEPPTPAQTLSLRKDANRAMREGRYGDAARILENVVAKLPSSDPAAGSIRLDLSRIYIHNLKQPQRATVHLRRFIKTRPGDPATPSARRELCRILVDLGRTDPECER